MTDFAPIVPNLLSSTSSLAHKYANTGQYATGPGGQGQAVLTALNALPQLSRPATAANTINPLALYDLARANRGMSPLTARQSAAALRALTTGKAATPPRRPSFWQSTVGDLRSLVTSIPHLPGMLLNEARQLPKLGSNIAEATQGADSPLQALGNLASVPGLRMIPGAFVAQQLAADKEHGGQGVQGLLAHPLFTALDVLPLASGAAKTTKVAKTAEGAWKAQVESLTAARMAEGMAPGTAGHLIPKPPRPLQTVLTRTLTPEGAVVPNALGRGLGTIAEDLKATSIGHSLYTAFGERGTSRITNQMDQFLREWNDPNIPSSSLQPPIPGGLDAIRDEIALRDIQLSIKERLTEHVGKPLSPEAEAFVRRAKLSETPDGTPIAPEQMFDWTPEQKALARDIRDYTYKVADYTDALPGSASTKSVLIDGQREVYDYRTSGLISKAQGAEKRATEIFEARQAALATADNPSTLSRDEIAARSQDVKERLANHPRNTPGRDHLQILDALYDKALEGVTRPTVTRVLPMVQALAKAGYARAVRLTDYLKRGMWSDANTELRALAKTKYASAAGFDLEGLQGEVSRLIERDRVLSKTAHVDERYVARQVARRTRIENQYNPARFDPLVRRAAKEATANRIREVFSHDPDFDVLMRLADEGLYDKLVTKDPRFARWVREDQIAARESWKALRDAGHDPIFFSNVSHPQAFRQLHPRMSDRPVTLQSVRKRMMDATPYMEDAGIIVTQMGLDIINRRGTEAALAEMGRSYGRTRADIMASEIEPRVLNAPEGQGRARAAQMFDRKYRAWEPGQFLGGKNRGTFNVEGAEKLYVPRAVAENLQRMYEPPLPKLTAAFDPILNAFRTSVLPLALRWQVNNVMGNIIVTSVADPRAFLELPGVLKQMVEERRNGLPEATERIHIPGAPPPGIGSMDPEMLRWQAENRAKGPIHERIGEVTAAARWGSGKTARNLFDTARESRLSKITDPAKRALEKSYGFNQFLDDMNRSMVGRSAKKRALRKGFTEEASDALAVQSIRRVFQSWDEMTPMERSVMRSIVPFYGFAAYATKFALRYPFDHPFRVSVLDSIARAELTDAMTGLPDYIREMILLGDPRANGHVRALNVSPFNPFGGVPDMFTRAGFLGQMNPVITSALESIGVDVRQGGPQLYPELRYDPESGRLVADPGGNFFSNLVGNTVPQVGGIMSLLGRNDEFNDALQRDPAAAGRMLMGNFGLPVLFRDVNIGDQLIKAEMARYEDQENARKKALTEGDLSILGDFPGLAAYGEQIRALQASGQLDQLRPAADVPGAPSGAGLAYAAQAALTG